ncbi:hypothetical protein HWV07_11405 [Natronomonas salina]|uniref:hypothetical protein n=1 Tax=Natronomonas salina TaxID=1710540 RepID=UPI0015B50493|nr:hypothetical protein [Natronomonas salina]QLD89603.1 hypothetical protein HWV07_11405 [Natronomonas salina]
MALPDAPLGDVLLGGGLLAVAGGAAKLLGDHFLGWFREYRANRRERVREWHNEVLGLLTEVRSVGVSVQTSREVPFDEIEELKPKTVELRKKVDPFPVSVRRMVDAEVLGKTRAAAALAFHLTHFPHPEEDASVSKLIKHQYEILERLGTDTSVEVDEALELIGDFQMPEKSLDVSPDEVDTVLEDFEDEARERFDGTVDTVDELLDLPWETLDRVISEETRKQMIEYGIDQYYQIALLDKPQETKSALSRSMHELFG